ncbi:MAG: AsnC family transcriptional regulator [Candidatus Woesearchaeota archaeon]|jgi:DNA-binding Lrp family transcriptional regulator
MKENDMQILSCLRSDARMSLMTISKAVNMCRTAVRKRLKQYETSIEKYSLLLNFQRMGFFHVIFFITLAKEDKEIFGKYIQQHPYLNTLYEITDADYAGEMVFKTHAEVEDFFNALENAFTITEKQVFLIKKQVTKECFLQQNQYMTLQLAEVHT